ncbi:putative Ig domain-containing protein [Streptomyces sp. NPDC051218]|uniref:putative Ig domain-containing protein n=1 Tax=Streptomyces sp. NPDC051218 TaxID=3365645 RepID=UPI00378A0234
MPITPRSTTLRAALAGTVACLTLAAFPQLASAQATSTPPPPAPGLLSALQRDLNLTPDQARTRLADERAARDVATRLRSTIGDRVVGMWFDGASGKLHANLNGSADAATAGRLGAIAHRTAYTPRELTEALAVIRGQVRDVPGVVSWGVDQRAGRIDVVTAADRHTPETERLLERLRSLGDIVSHSTVADAPRQQQGSVVGGEKWIPGSESPCSVGFSVTASGGAKGFLTAGHCTNDANQPAYGKDGSRVGTSNQGGSHSINAREGDFGLVAVDQAGWDLSPKVSGYGQGDVTVTGSAEGVVGQSVCRSGQTSGWRCGVITKVNQSVDYGNVVIDGLSWTDACSSGGDSGGSYVTATGGKAVGLHSGGGSATCGSSGTTNTIFQPVNEALQKWNLALATSNPQPGDVTVGAVSDRSGTVGQSATLNNTAQGGTAPYRWSASGLPAGLRIDASTGTVTGTPTTASTSTVTLTATDAAGKTGSTTFNWTVTAPGGGTLALTHPGNQTVYTGRPYSLPLTASGGTGARTFTATGLPAGLAINAGTGTISGSPTAWGIHTSRITVKDGAGKTAAITVNWNVFN